MKPFHFQTKKAVAPYQKALSSDNVKIKLDDNKVTVYIAGRAGDVKKVSADIYAIIQKLEDELKRSKAVITETISILKRHQILMLLAHEFPQDMQNR